jgi:type III pantothenate kinase
MATASALPHAAFPLVAVDIGNTRLKLGVFQPPLADPLPHPVATLSLGREWTAADLDAFLPLPPADYTWAIASVNRPACAHLVEWLAKRGVSRVKQLAHTDLPLAIEVNRPDHVGMDRLVNAVAINRLRQPQSPAIIIDMGTALKLDLVSRDGAFAGGSILLGIAMSARALHEFTDLLPLVEVVEPPPAVGKSTRGAMSSGLYWGAVGAVRELIAQFTSTIGPAEIYLTGGAGPLFANVLDQESARPPQFVPHLTLAGIAIAAPARGTP